ncbi:hypothetical protein GCK72_008740 [Caenorhabditis remanei]|uniref:BHLH domain-containing protein n=1 Tax=Caenorhabditis remanei TaxID=31234 RepID=A0A6A5H0F1_CAERE|nr:hypothetical protein GCK72_008740 [Caenorhabditis remanei]KAF1760491.1 hypothetical protein GCK72_008740 [Caenorhabditis remanei]
MSSQLALFFPKLHLQSQKLRKKRAEEKRMNAFNTAIGDIREELIQKKYGNEQDLKSHPSILILVAEIINKVDLKSKYPVEARRKCEGGKMKREVEKEVKARREQMRRDKMTDALEHIREFIIRNSLGNGKLEQVTVLQIILDYLRTLPINVPDTPIASPSGSPFSSFSISSILSRTTLSPGLPTLTPSPPLTQPAGLSMGTLRQLLNFPSPFPMTPMDRTAFQLQFQFQYLQNQMMLQNLLNPNEAT